MLSAFPQEFPTSAVQDIIATIEAGNFTTSHGALIEDLYEIIGYFLGQIGVNQKKTFGQAVTGPAPQLMRDKDAIPHLKALLASEDNTPAKRVTAFPPELYAQLVTWAVKLLLQLISHGSGSVIPGPADPNAPALVPGQLPPEIKEANENQTHIAPGAVYGQPTAQEQSVPLPAAEEDKPPANPNQPVTE